MSLVTTQQLEFIAILDQERRRRENEAAEAQQRAHEFAVQRCETETGITDNRITHAMAGALLRAQRHESRDMNNVIIYTRELARLQELALQGPNLASTEDKLLDCEHNIYKAKEELTRGRRARTEELNRLINTCRVEFTRAEGNRAAEDVIGNRLFPVPWGEGHLTAGQPNDYYTIQSPEYEHGVTHPDLAHRFRGITMRTNRLTLRSVMLRDVDPYRDMMSDPVEFAHGRVHPELDERLVKSRFHISGVEADRGGSYSFTIADGHPGKFIGIASLNCFADVDPNTFFGSDRFDNQPRRMVDFSLQFHSTRYHPDLATEVLTALIEFARIRLGCELFRSECSPFDAQHSASMEAVGLGKFRAIEPLSYNPAVAAATWKFDFSTWESVKDILIFRNRFFMTPKFIISPKNKVPDRPPLPIPELAVVRMSPSLPGDPVSHYICQDQMPAPMPPPEPMQEIEYGEQTGEASSSSSTIAVAVAVAATKALSEAGSGLGFSDSSHAASSATRSNSYTGTSASSSSAAPDGVRVASVWLGYEAMKAQWEQEASRLMPPPTRPNVRDGVSPQPTSSADADVPHTSEADAEESTSPAAALHDPKGKRRADPPPRESRNTERISSAPVPHDPKGKGRASVPVEDSDAEMAAQPSAMYDRKGKRPAAGSWESQPKKPSPLHQTSTPDEAESSDLQLLTTALVQPANLSPQSGTGMSDCSSPHTSGHDSPDSGSASPNMTLVMHHAPHRDPFSSSPTSSHNDSMCWSPPQSPLVAQVGQSRSLTDTTPSSSLCSPTEQKSPPMREAHNSPSSSWARACEKFIPPTQNADEMMIEPAPPPRPPPPSTQAVEIPPSTASTRLPAFGANQSPWHKYADLVVQKANRLMQPEVTRPTDLHVTAPQPQTLGSPNIPRREPWLDSPVPVQSQSDADISRKNSEAPKLKSNAVSVQPILYMPSPQVAPDSVQQPRPVKQKPAASGQTLGPSPEPSIHQEEGGGFKNMTIYNCASMLVSEAAEIAKYERQLIQKIAPQAGEAGRSSRPQTHKASQSPAQGTVSRKQNDQFVSAGSAAEPGVGKAKQQTSRKSLPLAIRERQQTNGKKSITSASAAKKNTRKPRQGPQSPLQNQQGRRGSVTSRSPQQKGASNKGVSQSGTESGTAVHSKYVMYNPSITSMAPSSTSAEPRQGVPMQAPGPMPQQPSAAATPVSPAADKAAYSASPSQSSDKTKERPRLPPSTPTGTSQAKIVDLTQDLPYTRASVNPAPERRFVPYQPVQSAQPTQMMLYTAAEVQQVCTGGACQCNAASQQETSPQDSTPPGEMERPDWGVLFRASTEREAARQAAVQQALYAERAAAVQREAAASQASHPQVAFQQNDNNWDTAPDPPLAWQTAPWATRAAQALSQHLEAPQPVRPNSVVLLQTSEQEAAQEGPDEEAAAVQAKRRPWQL